MYSWGHAVSSGPIHLFTQPIVTYRAHASLMMFDRIQWVARKQSLSFLPFPPCFALWHTRQIYMLIASYFHSMVSLVNINPELAPQTFTNLLCHDVLPPFNLVLDGNFPSTLSPARHSL